MVGGILYDLQLCLFLNWTLHCGSFVVVRLFFCLHCYCLWLQISYMPDLVWHSWLRAYCITLNIWSCSSFVTMSIWYPTIEFFIRNHWHEITFQLSWYDQPVYLSVPSLLSHSFLACPLLVLYYQFEGGISVSVHQCSAFNRLYSLKGQTSGRVGINSFLSWHGFIVNKYTC